MASTWNDLEAAIPEHLKTSRTRSSKLPEGYRPPFPAYTARFPKSLDGLVMAIIGFQWPAKTPCPDESLEKLLHFMRQQPGDATPRHWDLASSLDKEDYQNFAVLAYWSSWAEFDLWMNQSGFDVFWRDLKPGCAIGWFKEIFSPSMDRLETVFSNNDTAEGIAHMRESISGQLQEHVYWGSMRDRLPASQTDELVGDGILCKEKDELEDTKSRKIRIPGRKNLAMIRSGQDWSDTDPHERDLYLKTMHPVLIKGMNFLMQEGTSIGCFSNRFMEVLDDASPRNPSNKTFGLGYFNDLTSLEQWSKQHKTHLDIFARFIQYAAELRNNVKLKLFHEVMVLQPEQQFFEYIGCHSGTGMLASRRTETDSL
ncbi:hypothetical protein MBLNU13_g04491t1 [Cladosporium sp. NU13]